MKGLYVKFKDDRRMNGFTKNKEYKVHGLGCGLISVVDDGEDNHTLSKIHFTQPYTKEEKQNIFTHPKWVTAKGTNLEIGLVADRDYLVTRVEEDRYWVENPSQSNTPVWYKKERFYKVTPEDLLPPKKKSVEHIDEGFEDLVYVAPEEDQVGISYSKLSKEQKDFLLSSLPFNKDWGFDEPNSFYIDYNLEDTEWYTEFIGCPRKEISFNDIFKRV